MNFTRLLGDYEDAYSTLEQDAGRILTQNLQDRSVRSGLSLAGWKPEKDTASQAVEWWAFDFEYAQPPVELHYLCFSSPMLTPLQEQSSHEFAIVNYVRNLPTVSLALYAIKLIGLEHHLLPVFGREQLCVRPTWFQRIHQGRSLYFLDRRRSTAASEYCRDQHLLRPRRCDHQQQKWKLHQSRLRHLHVLVGVTVMPAVFSLTLDRLGVLQSDTVAFEPELPDWKRLGIETFSMGTYTKIFLQFPPDQVFWDTSYQFFLYADPHQRGYYPIFQSLDGEGFLPGSGIIFVTVVQSQSYVVEAQDDQTTKEEVLAVLRDMFGAENVPEPIAFMYPRWSLEAWAYGSYSNW